MPGSPTRLVPRLRFPEFRDSGEWRLETLSRLLKAEASKITQKELKVIDRGYPVYGADGLVGRNKKFEQNEDYIAIVKDGAGVGRVYYYYKYSSVLGTLTYLRVSDSDAHDLAWVYYLLPMLDFSKYIV